MTGLHRIEPGRGAGLVDLGQRQDVPQGAAGRRDRTTPTGRVDRPVAEVDRDVQIRRVSLQHAEVTPQADRGGVAADLRPELAGERAGPLGVDRSIGTGQVDQQRDDSGGGQRRHDEGNEPGPSPIVADPFQHRGGPGPRQQADPRREVLHHPRRRAVRDPAIRVSFQGRRRQRQAERGQHAADDRRPAAAAKGDGTDGEHGQRGGAAPVLAADGVGKHPADVDLAQPGQQRDRVAQGRERPAPLRPHRPERRRGLGLREQQVQGDEGGGGRRGERRQGGNRASSRSDRVRREPQRNPPRHEYRRVRHPHGEGRDRGEDPEESDTRGRSPPLDRQRE